MKLHHLAIILTEFDKPTRRWYGVNTNDNCYAPTRTSKDVILELIQNPNFVVDDIKVLNDEMYAEYHWNCPYWDRHILH